MMKKIFSAVVALSLTAFLLFATVTVAAAKPTGPFYVGVFGAFVVPEDPELEGWGEDRDLDFDDSWALGAKFGYILPQLPWMAVELEYTYLAEQDYDESISYYRGQVRDSLDGDFSAHNVMANFLFRYPQGKIHPFAGFGLGVSRGSLNQNFKRKVNGETWFSFNSDEDDTAFASQFIAGVNFELIPNLSLDLLYKYFYCEYEFDDDAELESGNHLFQLGINFHF